MKTKIPGTRVFAILSANSNEVYLIGRGKYLGEIPFKTAEDNVRLMGISPSEIEKALAIYVRSYACC